jgi:hypothetical protein
MPALQFVSCCVHDSKTLQSAFGAQLTMSYVPCLLVAAVVSEPWTWVPERNFYWLRLHVSRRISSSAAGLCQPFHIPPSPEQELLECVHMLLAVQRRCNAQFLRASGRFTLCGSTASRHGNGTREICDMFVQRFDSNYRGLRGLLVLESRREPSRRVVAIALGNKSRSWRHGRPTAIAHCGGPGSIPGQVMWDLCWTR